MKAEQRNRNERWQLAVKIVCAAIASLLVGAFTASELFALSTRFSPSLGEHYFYLYPPWAIATWWSKWHTNAPASSPSLCKLGGALAVILCMAYTIHVVTRCAGLARVQRHPRQRALGEALRHQEGRLDAARRSLRRRMEERLKIYTLRHNGPEHVLCYAPPRSGKGVGLVVPTMLTWPHSAVVTDLKREIYELTAKLARHRRNKPYPPIRTGQLDASVPFNPLDEIRIGTEHETGDMQNLANLIVDPDGKAVFTHIGRRPLAPC